MLCRNCGLESKEKICNNCGYPIEQAGPDEKENGGPTEKDVNTPNKVDDIDDAVWIDGEEDLEEDLEEEDFEETDFKEEEEPIPDNHIVVRKKVVKEKRRKPKRRKKTKVKKIHKKRVKKLKGRKSTYIPKILVSGLRLGSLFLLAFAVYLLMREFWLQKDVLGNWKLAFEENNYAFASYGGVAAITLIFGGISFLWILLRRKLPDGNKFIKVDTGRGLTAFVLLAISALGSTLIISKMPNFDGVWNGLFTSIQVYASLKTPLLWISIIGCISCIGRKVLSR